MPSPHPSSSVSSLLPGFTTARSIIDGNHPPRTKVNLVGIVTDYRVPIPTRQTDWKCQIRLYDRSTEDDSESLELNIFRPQDEMPTASCGDVLVLLSVTVQSYSRYAGVDGNPFSLLTNRETKIHVYQASKIPKPPQDASGALLPPLRKQDRPPGKKENAYVSTMFHHIDKSRVPDKAEFEVMKIQSANVKNKFCELKDAADGRFCDIVAQIVKPPFDLGDKLTLWVSDYTENSAFFNYSFGGKSLLSEGRDGDTLGYTNKFTASTEGEWQGPFGKRSIQITVYEPHASALRSGAFRVDTWVLIQNLQVKYGHSNSNLEGFLRGDQGLQSQKIRITKLDPMADPETINPHLKPAIRRKRDYEKTKKDQIKEIKQAAQVGKKRRADLAASEPKMNSKQRRKQSRALNQKKVNQAQQVEDESPPAVSLNHNVRCENDKKAVSSVAEVVESVYHVTTIDGENVKLQLPFVNAKYRVNVHVVNFMPPDMADFAVPKKTSTEFDVLSDNEDGSSNADSSESETDSDSDTTGREWEWRFFLQLEDAAVAPKQEKNRIWVLVNNPAAQCLTSLNASNLRQDTANLEQLRQRLFLLWGNLEEHKAMEEQKRAKSKRADQPPEDSSDVEQSAQKKVVEVANLPFPCCIQQYGVKVREPDATKADAGGGKRWARMFGLFGTRIRAD